MSKLNYVSDTLWHFSQLCDSTEASQKLKPIKQFVDANSKSVRLLKGGASSKQFREVRKYSFSESEKMDSILEPESTQSSLLLKEPTAICFADIPIHYLDIHAERYKNCFGFGFGFDKERVLETLGAKIQPVRYLHKINLGMSSDLFQENPQNSGDKINILKSYVKIPSARVSALDKSIDESFESIYKEREWRTLSQICCLGISKHLRYFILPESTQIESLFLFHKNIANLFLANSVSIVALDHIFGMP